MPEPVSSVNSNAAAYYDEGQGVCAAPPPPASTSSSHVPDVKSGLDDDPAAQKLVKNCNSEAVKLLQAELAVAGSLVALATASPTLLGTLPAAIAVAASSVGVGKAAADYANCRDALERNVGSGL